MYKATLQLVGCAHYIATIFIYFLLKHMKPDLQLQVYSK